MKLEAWIELQRSYAQLAKHRRLVVFSGRCDWGRQHAANVCPDQGDVVWLGTHGPDGVEQLEGRQAARLLGRTLTHLVLDCWDGFNPNALGQASGALQGGGLLILICPPLEQWPEFDDPEHRAMAVEPFSTTDVGRRFISRFCARLKSDPYSLIVREQGGVTRPHAPTEAYQGHVAAVAPTVTPTQDQQQVVAALLHTARNRRQPLVITADRGRGKSSAMGMAAARLLREGKQVLVTASQYSAVQAVFEFAALQLPDARQTRGVLALQDAELRFLTPEQLQQSDVQPHIVLVDEAATLPVPVLTHILTRFSRVVFATTVHGYEGTGRGFTIRFHKQLALHTPRWRGITMTQPVRWAAQDPVEALVFDSLLLNAEAASDSQVQAAVGQPLKVERLDRTQLAADPVRLRQVFGLLVLAHYRTTPGDLRVLLDSPNLNVWCMHTGDTVLACGLVADEGPLPAELAEAVWAGTRRPPGNLLPQTLVAQAGFVQAAALRCARIMRIAVHPAAQRQGLGARVLKAVVADAAARGLDYVGASFAASADLLPFWQQCGFQPVRLGQSRDAVSGSYAVVVTCALSPAGHALQQQLRQRYAECLPAQLSQNFAGLEAELIPALLYQLPLDAALNAQDIQDLKGFALFNRSLDTTAFALRKLALHLGSCGVLPRAPEARMLLLDQLAIPAVQRDTPHGRKWLVQQLRVQVAECLHIIAAI